MKGPHEEFLDTLSASGRVIAVDARMAGNTGIGRYVTGLLRYMSDHRASYSFDVVALLKSGDRDNRALNVRTCVVTSSVFSLREQFEIPALIAKVNACLVHAPQFNVPLFARALILVTIQDCAFDRVPDERASLVDYAGYKMMMTLALKRATKIIAASHATKADLLDIYNVPERKIVVIHHGLDARPFQSSAGDGTTWSRVKTKLDLDVPYVLYIGLVRPRKNIRNLLIALRLVRDRWGQPFKLLMAGPVDDRFIDVHKEARSLGISDIVVHAGFVPDEELVALYRRASMVVLPSLLEGFGLPLLEGMASGVPVIASDIPAHREIAANAALLAPPTDVNALAEAMLRVFSDPELAKSLVQRGFERVKCFSWETTAKRTLSVYEELLGTRHPCESSM